MAFIARQSGVSNSSRSRSLRGARGRHSTPGRRLEAGGQEVGEGSDSAEDVTAWGKHELEAALFELPAREHAREASCSELVRDFEVRDQE